MEYESVIIIKPGLIKKKLQEVIENFEDKIKQYAEILKKDEIGLRKLAYEVRKNTTGYYVVHEFQLKDTVDKDDAIRDIQKHLRTNDEIIKFITIKRD